MRMNVSLKGLNVDLDETSMAILAKLGLVFDGDEDDGVEEKTNPRRPSVPRTPQRVILVKTTCRTCGAVTEKFFLLEGIPSCSCSVPITPERESTIPRYVPRETRKETTIRCKDCRRNLSSLSKEELITKILHMSF